MGIRKIVRSVLIAGILVGASIFASATQADAAAGQYHLDVGQKLTVGQCIVSGPGQHRAVAKLCMGNHANALIYYKGVLVDEVGPNRVTSAQPRACITLASDHNVKIVSTRWANSVQQQHRRALPGDPAADRLLHGFSLLERRPGQAWKLQLALEGRTLRRLGVTGRPCTMT